MTRLTSLCIGSVLLRLCSAPLCCGSGGAFAVLPGGLGTLDEMIEIVTWRQLRLHKMPVILIDHQGYWKPFYDLINHVVKEGFAHSSVKHLYTIVSDVEDVISTIKAQLKAEVLAKSDFL